MNKLKFLLSIAACMVVFIAMLTIPVVANAASEDAYAEWVIFDGSSNRFTVDSKYFSYTQSSDLLITPSYNNTGSTYAIATFQFGSIRYFTTLSGTKYNSVSASHINYGLGLTSTTKVTIDTKFSEVSSDYLNYDIMIVWANYGTSGANSSGVTITADGVATNSSKASNSNAQFQTYNFKGYTADTFTISRYYADSRLCYVGIRYNAMPIEFGERSTDSGYYYKNSDAQKYGVIRFLQLLLNGSEVSEYGFYFVDEDGSIESHDGKSIGNEGTLNTEGFYGDLYGIPEGSNDTFYAKPYAICDGTPVYSDIIEGYVNWNRKIDYTE